MSSNADIQAAFNDPQSSDILYSNEALNITQSFQILEIAENNGTMQNVSSVDIDLNTSRWNVSQLELEITNMTFINETKVIEDNPIDEEEISKFSGYDRLAVQMNINAKTIIYGIYIYGRNSSTEDKDIRFQIGYYDEIKGCPNGTIFHDNPLNMTKSVGEGWHLQKFNPTLNLSRGKYSIIINGDAIGGSPKSEYYWSTCTENPKYPDLNRSIYNGEWLSGKSGEPFLYKLIQRVNETFYPLEINMTAKINGNDYPILNKSKSGTGNLSISFNYTLFPNTSNWSIPIKNNVSDALIFNVSYHIKLNHTLTSVGSVYIKKNQDNLWILNPFLDRFGYNYTVIYDYPDHWNIRNIFRGGDNVTSDSGITYDGGSLYINNSTILYDSVWKIEATSIRYNLTINTEGKTSYKAGELLGFFVEKPPPGGNCNIILVDPIGIIFHTQTNESSGSDILFQYNLPTNSRNGEWTTYVFWNNETDAGMQTQAFQISGGVSGITFLPPESTTTGIDPLLLTIIFITISGVAGISVVSYSVIRKIRKNLELYRKKQQNRAYDILNLQDVIVISKESGLNVYEEHYSGRAVDATLVSGFLDAIRSFGIELTGASHQTQTISLEYKDSIVIMSEYKNFRLIFIMSDKPSEEFYKNLNELSYEIGEKYGEKIEKYSYDTRAFVGLHDVIQKHLKTAFIFPLRISEPEDIKLSSTERDIINSANRFMKQNNLDYFFVSFLFTEEKIRPEQIEAIFNLIEKDILQPIELESKIS